MSLRSALPVAALAATAACGLVAPLIPAAATARPATEAAGTAVHAHAALVPHSAHSTAAAKQKPAKAKAKAKAKTKANAKRKAARHTVRAGASSRHLPAWAGAPAAEPAPSGLGAMPATPTVTTTTPSAGQTPGAPAGTVPSPTPTATVPAATVPAPTTTVPTTTVPADPGPDPTPVTALGVSETETPVYRTILTRTTVPAGRVVVQLVNQGEDPHNLRLLPITGSGTPETFDEVAPGGIATKTLTLAPGQWRLYCTLTLPVSHDGAGMHATLDVVG